MKNNIMQRFAPWVSLTGIFTLIVGLGLDAILHRRDPGLAEHEGIFTLSNPGHLLFAIGIALCVFGALFFLAGRIFDGKFSLLRFVTLGSAASLLIVCSLISFALAVSTQGALAGTHSHTHVDDPAASTEGTLAGPHSHPQTTDPAASTANANTHDHETTDLGQFPHQHLDMGPHIVMPAVRPQTSEDIARANAVKSSAEQALAKYKDVRVAEQDGYKMFGAERPNQPEFHFSKTANSILAIFTFDPTKPTSLLYHKDTNGNFVLTGVMYLTPASFNEAQLDQRYPISMGQWHKHVNICWAPQGVNLATAYLGPNAKFGPAGSITTQSDCVATGGAFKPTLFGWMVHVYF